MTMRKIGVALLACIHHAAGHGYLFEPPSRQRLANEAGLDYCPHCTLASPMVSEAQGAPSRPYPGSRAFADPGTASSAGFLYNGNSPFGVCGESHTEGTRDGLPCGGLGSAGTQQLGTNDYNYPGGRTDSKTGLLTWGEKFTEVQAGAVLDVSWCVNADHGGNYQFRLCKKRKLVKKLWANGPMSSKEQEELEECYQAGILPCDDVNSNDCSLERDCDPSWGCGKKGLYFHCGDGSNTKACAFHGTGRTCNGGVVVERKVLIPRNFPVGNTVLTWRWDSHDTTEVFAACADITITPADRTPTKAPVPQPLPKPTKAPKPAPNPPAGDSGYCCWWGPNEKDRCSPCESFAEPTSWCGSSKKRCKGCGNGVWCKNGPPDGDPDPEPEPEPTPKPSADRDGYSGGGEFCCFDGGCTKSCYAPVFDSYYCGQSEDACEGCGGVWCD